jgi:iron complex outermembrane recepter protein
VDWNDVQQVSGIQVPNTTLFAVASVNGESASGLGAELALTMRPIDALDLRFGASWNDITMDQDVFANSIGLLLYEKGDRLSQSPEYNASLSAEYSLPLGAGGYQARLLLAGTYTAEQNSSTIFGGKDASDVGDAMLMTRLRLAIEAPSQQWSGALFVDNLNDERGSPMLTFPGFPQFNIRVRPRTVGVQLEYRFGR